MTREPLERLEEHGRGDVPKVDAAFVDRLESKLRVEHSEVAHRGRRRVVALLPRLGIAAAVMIASVVGVIAFTESNQQGVPVSVIEDDLISPVDEPSTGDDGNGPKTDDGSPAGDDSDAAAGVDQPTPTTTPVAPDEAGTEPTPSNNPEPGPEEPDNDNAVREPTSTPDISVSPANPTVEPAPSPTVEPTPTVGVATPVPTPIRSATAVPVPSPTPRSTATPEPTAVRATPVPATPTPVSVPEPALIELTCEVRIAGDAVGVACEWTTPPVDTAVIQYQVWRSLNGADAVVVSRQRAAAPTVYVDRAVNPGDEVAYLVRGLDASEQIRGASVREVVSVPAPE